MVLTFGLVVIGWVFFRADTITEAFDYFHVMFSTNLISIPWLMTRDFYLPLVGAIIVLVVVEWLQRNHHHGLEQLPIKQRWLRWLIYMLVCVYIYQFGQFDYHQFIYFQF